MFRHDLREHLTSEDDYQWRSLEDLSYLFMKARCRSRSHVLDSEHSCQSQQTPNKGVPIDDTGKRAAQGYVDDPIEDGDGSDGTIAAYSEVGKKYEDGDRANHDWV